MEQERRALNQLLHPRIQASAPLAAAFATSLPGCGPILAAMPLAELDALDRGKIASLAAKSDPFGERCRQLTAKAGVDARSHRGDAQGDRAHAALRTLARTRPDPRPSHTQDRTRGRKLALFLDVRLWCAMPLPHTGEEEGR
jgi:hypothetical protein